MKKRTALSGFSVVEIVVAIALFMIFATGAISTLLSAFVANRSGAEETIANQFATEGIEAVLSIKNQSFTSVVNTFGTGIAKAGGVWTLNGANNTLFHNNNDDYIRVITVSDVQREGNGSGNIVQSGGIFDPDTKKVTATVTWKASPTRNNSTSLTTYISNFRKSLTPKGGMLVYGDGGSNNDSIKYRILDGNDGTWSAPASASDIDTATTNKALKAARVYASATRNEKILLSRHYNNSTQYIYAQVYNGASWNTPQLLSSWNSNNFLDVRNFDGTYVQDGKFMAIYSDNTTTPKSRIWDGSSWSAQSSLQALTGVPTYITAKARPGQNEIITAFFSQNRDTHTQYFNGTNWTLHTRHSNNAPTTTKELIDFTWNPQNVVKGALVFAGAAGDKEINIKIWTANGTGGGSWSSSVNSPSSGDKIGPLSITSRNGAEEFLVCQKDENSDIYCFKSANVPAWSSPTNNILTTTSDTGIQRSFDSLFESPAGTLAITVYSDNTTTPKLKKYDAINNTFDQNPTSIPALNGVLKTVRLREQGYDNDIMILMGDGSSPPKLYSVVWNGSIDSLFTSPLGKAFTTHPITSGGSSPTDFWYDFAWDK